MKDFFRYIGIVFFLWVMSVEGWGFFGGGEGKVGMEYGGARVFFEYEEPFIVEKVEYRERRYGALHMKQVKEEFKTPGTMGRLRFGEEEYYYIGGAGALMVLNFKERGLRVEVQFLVGGRIKVKCLDGEGRGVREGGVVPVDISGRFEVGKSAEGVEMGMWFMKIRKV